MQTLAALGYRVYAPDLPGYGESPHPGVPVTLAYLRRVVAELVEALELHSFDLGGVSLGGGLSLAYALDHPEQVRRLLAVAPYGISSYVPGGRLGAWFVRWPGIERLNPWLARFPALVQAATAQIVRTPGALTPELLAEVTEAMGNPASAQAWNEFQRDEITPAGLKTVLLSRLPELTAPTLIVHGTADFTVPYQAAEEAARLLPRGELLLLPGAGHWTQRDQPQAFHSALARFLGGNAG